jgi:hypothetical protein
LEAYAVNARSPLAWRFLLSLESFVKFISFIIGYLKGAVPRAEDVPAFVELEVAVPHLEPAGW